MTPRKPMLGPGLFQWNSGAWFGTQIGCTAWMLAAAVDSIARRTPWAAALFLTGFAVLTAFGIGLWQRRDRLPPLRALILLVTLCGVGFLTSIAGASFLGRPDLLRALSGQRALLIPLAVVMAQFGYREWSVRRQSPWLQTHKRPVAHASSAGDLWDADVDA
jgi:hypothetical protein